MQKAINRLQDLGTNRRCVEALRRARVKSLNFDLIYGLPLQTPVSFAATLQDVLSLGPDRLSVFSYAHVPWLRPAQRIFETRGQLLAPERKLELFALAHETLTRSGFLDIGLDHFARPEDELAVAQRTGTLHRNFQGYTTQAGASLYSFGITAISQTPDTYRQNFKTLEDWRAAVVDGRLPVEKAIRLSPEDQRRRRLIMSLMCERRIRYASLSKELQVDVAYQYHPEIDGLEDLERDGLLERDENGVTVLPAGVPLLRVIAARFDPTFTGMGRRHASAV